MLPNLEVPLLAPAATMLAGCYADCVRNYTYGSIDLSQTQGSSASREQSQHTSPSQLGSWPMKEGERQISGLTCWQGCLQGL